MHRQGDGSALPSSTQHSCCFPCLGSWLALLWEKGPPLSGVREPHARQLDAVRPEISGWGSGQGWAQSIFASEMVKVWWPGHHK